MVALEQVVTSWRLWHSLGELEAIHQPDINLCVWRRQPPRWLAGLVREVACRQIKRVVECDPRQPALAALLQDLPRTLPGLADFQTELHAQIALFARLLPGVRVQLKLESTASSMCERFHIDRVALRSICTYFGPGTEWVDDRFIDRNKLGPGAQGQSDEESGLLTAGAVIEQMQPFDVGLMKGSLWPGPGSGLVHRSPRRNEKLGRRVLFKIDAILPTHG